jgi:hypothetical protein
MNDYEIVIKAKQAQEEILNCSKTLTHLSPQSAPTYYEIASKRLSNEITQATWEQFCKQLKK